MNWQEIFVLADIVQWMNVIDPDSEAPDCEISHDGSEEEVGEIRGALRSLYALRVMMAREATVEASKYDAAQLVPGSEDEQLAIIHLEKLRVRRELADLIFVSAIRESFQLHREDQIDVRRGWNVVKILKPGEREFEIDQSGHL